MQNDYRHTDNIHGFVMVLFTRNLRGQIEIVNSRLWGWATLLNAVMLGNITQCYFI